MSWQILITISVITASIQTLLQRYLLKDTESKPVAYLIISQLVAALIIGIIAIIGGVQIPNLTPFIPNFILGMFLIGVSTILWFKSLKVMEASEFTVLWATRAFWSIIAAMLFLGESFSFKQAFGAILIFLSIVLLHWNGRKMKIGKPEGIALFAAALFGSQFANDGYVLKSLDPLIYIPIALVLQSVASLLIIPKTIFDFAPILKSKKIILNLLLLGTITAITIGTYLGSFVVGGNLSKVAAINQVQIITTVILAIIFLKESKDFRKKILAAIISFIGVLLVT